MNYAIAWTGIPAVAVEFITESGMVPRWAVVPLISTVFFVMGMFMESLACMLLILPSFLPVMFALGLDPIWIGVIMVLCIEIAMITPPVGMNFFVIARIAKLPMEKLMKAILPWVVVDLIGLMLVIIFPPLATWLPSTMLH